MTQAEWDAERRRRETAVATMWRANTVSLDTGCDALTAAAVAEATMPPRPFEPSVGTPSVTHGEWSITHDGEQFVAQHRLHSLPHRLHEAARMAVLVGGQDIDQLTLALIALRDGPLPQYEVCVGIAGLSGEPLYRQVTP